MQILEHIPDSAKVIGSISAPILAVFGLPMETWGYILSGIVSIMFIIEKFPIMLERAKQLYLSIKELWAMKNL